MTYGKHSEGRQWGNGKHGKPGSPNEGNFSSSKPKIGKHMTEERKRAIREEIHGTKSGKKPDSSAPKNPYEKKKPNSEYNQMTSTKKRPEPQKGPKKPFPGEKSPKEGPKDNPHEWNKKGGGYGDDHRNPPGGSKVPAKPKPKSPAGGASRAMAQK